MYPFFVTKIRAAALVPGFWKSQNMGVEPHSPLCIWNTWDASCHIFHFGELKSGLTNSQNGVILFGLTTTTFFVDPPGGTPGCVQTH